MFISSSTLRLSTGCLVPQNADVPSNTEKPIQPSFARLLDFAIRSTAGSTSPIVDEAGLRERLGVSNGRMTNWKYTRPISRDGALLAEKKLGCSATWLMSGVGDEQGHSGPSRPPAPEDTPRAISESQWQLLQDFDMLIPEEQNAIRKTLREKAAYARKIFEQMARRHNMPAPVADKRIEEVYGPPPDGSKKK